MRLAATDCGCVAAGAAGGALLRYGVSEWGKGKGQGPAAILLINVVGSFVLGGCTGALPGTRAALLVGTGFCGSFTTFSTYSVDGAPTLIAKMRRAHSSCSLTLRRVLSSLPRVHTVIQMARANQLSAAALYAVATNVLSIGAAAAGLQLGGSPAVARIMGQLPSALRLPPLGPTWPKLPPPP